VIHCRSVRNVKACARPPGFRPTGKGARLLLRKRLVHLGELRGLLLLARRVSLLHLAHIGDELLPLLIERRDLLGCKAARPSAYTRQAPERPSNV
jgi:hypothetical protein